MSTGRKTRTRKRITYSRRIRRRVTRSQRKRRQRASLLTMTNSLTFWKEISMIQMPRNLRFRAAPEQVELPETSTTSVVDLDAAVDHQQARDLDASEVDLINS